MTQGEAPRFAAQQNSVRRAVARMRQYRVEYITRRQ
jgi:hypothetical protein